MTSGPLGTVVGTFGGEESGRVAMALLARGCSDADVFVRPPTCDRRGHGITCAIKCGSIGGMNRVRISTTVDGARLAACRAALGVSDSKMLDEAMRLLLDHLEEASEREALRAMPYHEDADVAWETPLVSGLLYDGEIPEDVQRLAESRRRGA